MIWFLSVCVVAAIGPAVFIVLASYAGCERALVVTMFTLGMGLMGTFYSGIKANSLDLAPNYAGVVLAIANGSGSIGKQMDLSHGKVEFDNSYGHLFLPFSNRRCSRPIHCRLFNATRKFAYRKSIEIDKDSWCHQIYDLPWIFERILWFALFFAVISQ